MKKFNNGKLPSLNQISAGLIAEAMHQLKLAMGDVVEQKHILAAQANIKQTWEELLAEADVPDRDAPLGEIDSNNIAERGSILYDPNSSVVALILYIY